MKQACCDIDEIKSKLQNLPPSLDIVRSVTDSISFTMFKKLKHPQLALEFHF